MNRYEDHGYRNRNDYLCSLADDYGVDEDKVFALAELLGEEEDFDMLVTELEDLEDDLL
mgnify:CR=1 FL=1